MCGIVGIVGRSPVNPEALNAAVARVSHRGPDGHGAFISPNRRVGLGHTRLSIIDLSDAAGQPMRSRDGRYTLVFNGEIYNFRELRAELAQSGVAFRTHSDTEVLLEGYARFGIAYLSRLNGIFAFAILDSHSGEVLVARDPLGVKPLYYAETSQGVVFASEMKAIFSLADIDRSIDPDTLRGHLTFLWNPGNGTMLKQVRRLEPGSLLRLAHGRIAAREVYWCLPPYAPDRRGGPRRAAVELRELIDRCVDRQLVADVPVGAFLSGGLDSSAIVASARATGRSLRCFTIDAGDAEEGTTSDLPYARAVASALGVDLDEVRVDSRRFCESLLDLPRMLDEPIADPATLNTFFISQLARTQGTKVLLSGAGGDDLFSGYRRHVALAAEQVLSRLPAGLRRSLSRAGDNLPGSSPTARRLKKFLATVDGAPNRRIAAQFAWSRPGLSETLLAPELLASLGSEDALAPLERLVSAQGDIPPLEKCLRLEQRFFLADHNLIYVDKMSMAAGVETRVPLLDLELVEFAARLPVEWKLRGLTPKWILRQSQVGRLSREVLYRPKTGFGAPLRRWMRGEMREVMEELLSPAAISARGLFDPAAVARLRTAHDLQHQDVSYTLFSLMCVELWCRQFLDSSPAGGSGELEGAAAIRPGAHPTSMAVR